MIRNTLSHTKECTFAIIAPDPKLENFPRPYGTGFFISSDGYFLTALHVIKEVNTKKISIRKPEFGGINTSYVKLIQKWPDFDIALLKVDFGETKKTEDQLKNKNGFDFLEIDFSVQKEGTPVYSFGYPLPKIEIHKVGGSSFGFHYFAPRATSLIISSHYDILGLMVGKDKFPKFYVIDKALNYGNSGGPIVLQESGKVISVCVRFQPVEIPQRNGVKIKIPSLYGITSSLKNIEEELKNILKFR